MALTQELARQALQSIRAKTGSRDLEDVARGLINGDLAYEVATDAAATRIVPTTATALSLTITQHGERVVVVNTNSTVANTFTLPAATGSGVRFEVINGIAQTQGSIVIAANGTDVMKGRALSFDSTAVATHANIFVSSASSDKVTWNRTTTGGLGEDSLIAWDEAANTWRVQVISRCSGANATPFSET
jgi:hypothetical protein